MRRLSLILIATLTVLADTWAQNPHGNNLKVDCKACHTPGSWNYTANEKLFNHDATGFALEGRHEQTACKDCHTNLVFEEAENTCVACHTDVHSMSVGNDCARCHTPENWLVDNIPELHEANGFPLLGAHRFTACTDCHQSETNLRWDRIGNECAMCHIPDYNSTQDPNHATAGFSTNCAECHDPFNPDWNSARFNHNLTNQACLECHQRDFNNIPANAPDHSTFSTDCASCHSTDAWTPANFDHDQTSQACLACHQSDFNNIPPSAPDHSTFGTDCASCHSTNGWTPADFGHNDPSDFPIYSGNHDQGVWNSCTDCHIGGNYTTFSCIDCHEHNDAIDLADEHDDVPGYQYNSISCLNCHPRGNE